MSRLQSNLTISPDIKLQEKKVGDELLGLEQNEHIYPLVPKAYDRISWEFLEAVLIKMNFPAH